MESFGLRKFSQASTPWQRLWSCAIAAGLFTLSGCQLQSVSEPPSDSAAQRTLAARQALAARERVPVKLIPLSPLPADANPKPEFLSSTQPSKAQPQATPASHSIASKMEATEGLTYQAFELPKSTVHMVRIAPEAQVRLSIALSTDLTPVSDLAQMVPGAIAAINAGFFDPNNAHSINFITQRGKRTADPTHNKLLMTNTGIQPYLDKVLNRSEFRRYECQEKSGQSVSTRYGIHFHRDPVPANCKLTDAIGGGPQLLPRLTATEEAFWAEEKGRVLRDAIGMHRPNARSAIALTAKGEILLAMAAQRPTPAPAPSSEKATQKPTASDAPKPTPAASGLSLPDLALFLQGQGAVQALNLDGGSSSGLYVAPHTVYGKRDAQGQPIRRSVKSVLVVSTQN